MSPHSCTHLPLPCLIACEASALEPFPKHYLISWQHQQPSHDCNSIRSPTLPRTEPPPRQVRLSDPAVAISSINIHISLFNWLQNGKTVGGLTFRKSFPAYSKTVFFIIHKRILISALFLLYRCSGMRPPARYSHSVI